MREARWNGSTIGWFLTCVVFRTSGTVRARTASLSKPGRIKVLPGGLLCSLFGCSSPSSHAVYQDVPVSGFLGWRGSVLGFASSSAAAFQLCPSFAPAPVHPLCSFHSCSFASASWS